MKNLKNISNLGGEESSTARSRIGESMPDRRRDEDTAAIRVSNLSENVQDNNLSKEKMTGQCQGFAFINYYRQEDAAKAITTLNGFGYDHLILNVEWAKPSTRK